MKQRCGKSIVCGALALAVSLVVAGPGDAEEGKKRVCIYTFQEQHPEELIATCTEHLSSKLSNFERSNDYFNRAQAYEALKDYRNAFIDYDLALGVIAYIPETLAMMLQAGGRISDEEFTGAKNIRAGIWQSRGELFARTKDYDRAIADFTKGIDTEIEFWVPQALAARAAAYFAKKDYRHVIVDSDRRLAIYPNDDLAFFMKGISYVALNENDSAIAAFSEAININPKVYQYFHRRGQAYFFKKAYDKAIADYEAALKLSPNQPDVLKSLEAARKAQIGGR